MQFEFRKLNKWKGEKDMKRVIAALVAMAAFAYGVICLLRFEAGVISDGVVWLHIFAAAVVEWIALKAMEIKE